MSTSFGTKHSIHWNKTSISIKKRPFGRFFTYYSIPQTNRWGCILKSHKVL